MALRKPMSTLCLATGAIAAGLGFRALVRRRRYMPLADRTILITGGSRGLGLALARQAANRHARVVICARDVDELALARADIESRGGCVVALRCDVTVRAEVDSLIRNVVERFGRLDMLINNAGVIEVGPMQEMTIADYEIAIKTHFAAPVYTTLATLPFMRRQGGGRIVNVTSIGGKIAVPHLLPYTASKFALVGFSQGLRAELARENIFVTTVVPGLFRSGSARHAEFKGQHRKEYAWFSTAAVLPIVSISAERLASEILYAAQFGQPELHVPLLSSLQARFNGLFPGLTSEIAALINRVLPSPGGIGNRRAKGSVSDSAAIPAIVRARNQSAAEAHNEMLD